MDEIWIGRISFCILIFTFFICSIGLCLNAFLAFAIAKNKNLLLSTGLCGIFILILAIEDIICQFWTTTLNFFPSFIGPIPFINCFFLKWIGLWILPNIQILMLIISFDRLISVILPVRYKEITEQDKAKCFIFVLIALTAICTLYFPYRWYKYANENKEKIFVCTPTILLDSATLFTLSIIQYLSNFGMIFNYFLILALIKCKIVKIMQNSVEQRLLRTLIVLMTVTVLCWLPFPIINNFVIFYFKFPQNIQNFAIQIGIFPNKIAQVFNPIILYFCSSDYRQAIRKEFLKIWRKFAKGNGNENQIINLKSNIVAITPRNNNFIN